MDFATLLHWIYVGAMAAGTALFFAWYRNPKGVPHAEYVVAMLIPIWSGLAYTAMALGLGQVEVWGQTTYWARYADWIVSTPLLITALWMTASLEHEKKPWLLLGALVAADVIMILCGLVGDLSASPARFVFFGIGVAALVVLFALVWGPLRREAHSKGDALGRVFDTSAAYLAVFWVGYPLTWILGPSGLGVVGQPVDTALFVLLPIFSKVGFSIVDLGLLRRYVSGTKAWPAAPARAM
ncbi:bacteriorhodopsin [Rubrivirga sp. IMCC45206]|uniref:bacteriorhodopsin n=1 Tax=Rubrivirga sp. IMCC45206 TaxID=3391614 RepID=UPI00398FA82C